MLRGILIKHRLAFAAGLLMAVMGATYFLWPAPPFVTGPPLPSPNGYDDFVFSAVFGGAGEGLHGSLGHPSGMPDSPHRTPVLDWFSKVISEGGASRAAAGPAREPAGGSIHKAHTLEDLFNTPLMRGAVQAQRA